MDAAKVKEAMLHNISNLRKSEAAPNNKQIINEGHQYSDSIFYSPIILNHLFDLIDY